MEENSSANSLEDKDYLPAMNEISLSHHASVVQSFATSFVNTFSIFNAGAFAASAAIVPTAYGRAVLAEFPNLAPATLFFFASGFLLSSILMIVIFQYSLEKYKFYKDKIKSKNTDPVPEKIKFHVLGWIIFASILVVTCSGVIGSLRILLSLNLEKI